MELEIAPVGVKYSVREPDGIARLDGRATLCEMLKRAQNGEVFFADAKNHTCDAGLYVLGQTDIAEPFLSGEFAAGLGVFKDARAASRVYHYIPRIHRGVVNFVSFAPIHRMAFDPMSC